MPKLPKPGTVITFIATFIVFATVLLWSCSKTTNCDDHGCLNNGLCDNGKCTCPKGFVGEYCEKLTDSSCVGVTCLNSGTCVKGACSCPTGIGGKYCETFYREVYSNRYVGDGIDNAAPANNYTSYQAILSTSGTDLTNMNVTVLNTNATAYKAFAIVLSNCTDSGSTFTITATKHGDTTYTGSGTVSTTRLMLKLTETNTKTAKAVVYTFPAMQKK